MDIKSVKEWRDIARFNLSKEKRGINIPKNKKSA